MLEVKNLTYRIGARELFKEATFSLDCAAKVGIVGPNGAGKTTLFRLLTGECQPDGGEICTRRQSRFVQVKQEITQPDQPLLQFVLHSDLELMRLQKLLEDEATVPDEQLGTLYDELAQIDGFSAEARASGILAGLGFSQADLEKPLKEFSGGWQVRAALAATLFAPSDCLLLDEPTNHLDLETALWLENYLEKLNKLLLIVSHEKDFLNRLCDQILHVQNGQIRLYSGNYDTFLETREAQNQALLKNIENQERKREHLQEFVDRFGAKASKAKQAQSRMKALDKMEKIEGPGPEYRVQFSFPEPFPEVDRRLIALENVSLGYGDRLVLRDVNFRLDAGDRVALLGANGNGKSTLAKALAGRLQAISGKIVPAKRLKIAYFSQQQADELDLNLTPIEMFQQQQIGATETVIRTQLARFGITQARSKTRASHLSGGEKTRLLLALTSLQQPHLLILDEPTNHLDIEARDALIAALAAYRGAVLLVTHDFHTLRASCREFYVIDGGRCQRFDGTIEAYRSWLLTSRDVPAGGKSEKRSRESGKSRRDGVLSREELEEKISSLTERKALMEKQLAETYSDELYGQFLQCEQQLNAAENQWLQLPSL